MSGVKQTYPRPLNRRISYTANRPVSSCKTLEHILAIAINTKDWGKHIRICHIFQSNYFMFPSLEFGFHTKEY